MAPLTLLHVLAPAPTGGLERVARALAAGMAGRGHRVHVAALLDGGAGEAGAHPFVASLAGGGVAVHPVLAGGRRYLRERDLVAALARRVGADVVHTHGYRADVVHGRWMARRGVPAVTTVHGFTGGDLRNRLYERVQRAAFRGFGAVVAVSRPLAERLAADGVPRGRLHTLPNAWDGGAAGLARAASRARLGLPAEGFVVGWVGRLSREKGADVLVDALARLPDPALTAVVVGDGPERGRLEARARDARVAGRIRWAGAVADAAALFRAFDVLALSSRTEGTPMVLFEAAAAGVPVVATRVGGVPDVLGPAEAHLVPPEDPAALAAALRDVHLRRDEAARRADAATARVRLHFAPGPWLAAYESVYRGLRPPTTPSPTHLTP